jgi:hypothetical protein
MYTRSDYEHQTGVAMAEQTQRPTSFADLPDDMQVELVNAVDTVAERVRLQAVALQGRKTAARVQWIFTQVAKHLPTVAECILKLQTTLLSKMTMLTLAERLYEHMVVPAITTPELYGDAAMGVYAERDIVNATSAYELAMADVAYAYEPRGVWFCEIGWELFMLDQTFGSAVGLRQLRPLLAEEYTASPEAWSCVLFATNKMALEPAESVKLVRVFELVVRSAQNRALPRWESANDARCAVVRFGTLVNYGKDANTLALRECFRYREQIAAIPEDARQKWLDTVCAAVLPIAQQLRPLDAWQKLVASDADPEAIDQLVATQSTARRAVEVLVEPLRQYATLCTELQLGVDRSQWLGNLAAFLEDTSPNVILFVPDEEGNE